MKCQNTSWSVPDNSNPLIVNPLATNHIYWGTLIQDANSITGVQATQTILPTYQVTNGNTLYAPTICGPNYCPLEVVTDYNGGQLYWGIWDHTKDGKGNAWAVLDTVNSAFMSTYAPGGTYTCEILWQNGDWNVYLFDWNTGAWSYQGGVPYSLSYSQRGWDMWEAYYSTPYPTQPVIESSNLDVYVAGLGWETCNSVFGGSFTTGGVSPPYTTTWLTQYSSWEVYY
jgi:hypothetical protein